MKKLILVVLVVSFGVLPVFAQQQADPAKAILNHAAENSFLPGSVPKADLDRILLAGIRAPSARNRQPWHFTVVQSQSLANRILSPALDGNVYIVISASGGESEILDCGLAAQCIYLAAQALGYGSRIYTGPIDGINRSLKSDLGLPRGHDAVVMVRVGKIAPRADGLSAASSRKSAADVVSYK